ncbi:uncharacterized protein LOC143257847 [Tachypleus tridentatus]|uniref:uncharacterized protein LOC143257847 n=1 Tax=Tachypleus tridentatus TaxID=6853 RepID=UPI003FD0E6E6
MNSSLRVRKRFFRCVEEVSLSILKHQGNAPLVTNCSTTTLTCHVDTPSLESDVWWTFNGRNASESPNVSMVTEHAEKGIWKLQLVCPTLKHAGKYICNAQSRNDRGLVYLKKTTVNVFERSLAPCSRSRSLDQTQDHENQHGEVTL